MYQSAENTKGIKTQDTLVAAPIMMVLLLLAAIILTTGYAIWNGYRDEIMNNHKEELLLISHALADNMEASLEEFQGTLDFLCAQQEKAGSFEDAVGFYQEYLAARGGFEADVLLDTGDGLRDKPGPDMEKDGGTGVRIREGIASGGGQGAAIYSALGTEIVERQQVTDIGGGVTVHLALDGEGRHLFLFRKELPGIGGLCLAVDADRCYRRWISDVRIGTSGYIMVKNSSGIILLHPQPSQWGIHVISGRKEMFPNLDLASLEEMVEIQNRGEDGVSEYYSYWWLEEPLERVRKISGYAPVRLGDDFWVVSSVVDYSDYYAPIESGFSRLSFLFAVSLAAVVLLLLFVSTLLVERNKSRQEISTLRALNERLETIHRMEERIGHQQRLQVIGTMTGGIAHEFNNLLTPIMGYAEFLLLELAEDSEAYDSALEIYDASEKAREIVRQLSALSRRNVETVFKREDPLRLLQRACKMMRSICPADIRLEEDFDAGLAAADGGGDGPAPDGMAEGLQEGRRTDAPVGGAGNRNGAVILCNATQINQVLLNLCVNAIHAIHAKDKGTDGEIRVRMHILAREELKEAPQLKDREIPEDWESFLQIQVEDNGCGMAPEVLRQAFTPFFTTKKTGEGTGLGLTLAEQIILSHRGYIYADSIPAKGSVFTICLPLLAASARDGGLSVFPSSSRAKRIVIADDNVKILDMLRKSLAKPDLEVETCRTREKLKKRLDRGKTDALLIDESLEDGSGIDFCMSIQGLYPAMIKIIMADYPTNAILEAKQHGIIDGYVLKPFSDVDVIEEIRRCSAR